jgi:hypothetical protein
MQTRLFFFIKLILSFLFLSNGLLMYAGKLVVVGKADNDLFRLLSDNNIKTIRAVSPLDALATAQKGDAVIITASDYPVSTTPLTQAFFDLAQKKAIRLYIEYPGYLPGYTISPALFVGKLERGIITSAFFGKQLPAMSLLGLNDCHLISLKVNNPLISYAKVAGFDKAQFGLADTDVYPLLFQKDQMLVATSCLTNFYTARYVPNDSWKIVWTEILKWLTKNKNIILNKWQPDPSPSFSAGEVLPANAGKQAIRRGADWLFNGRFLIHPAWLDMVWKYQGDGLYPFGPGVGNNRLIGEGALGVLEGHASTIYHDGSGQYRYWLRDDVQGEVAFLLAAAGNLLVSDKYAAVSERLIDYIFYVSNFRKGARNERDSASYGLLGWSVTHPYVFYNDDNARAVLGMIGASAFLKNQRWNRLLVENILANLRTSSKQGFQGGRIEEPQVLANGWKYYYERDYTNPHPHFESWMWACYLWLYDKTKYPLLLEKAKTAIRITMDAYSDEWGWTNGIQQERARMLLCLAWLVRVEDTPEHREWLDRITQDVIKNQQSCGAIREELGSNDRGMFGMTRSNKEYGLHEAPLISRNGDPVADMLYTSNFAFFGLNEAAKATGNQEYISAVKKLADFLIRIQVKSNKHQDLDGAWFRAFDYDRWDYWASNADAGWGAWSTLTGWIQSWIVGTMVLLEKNTSYWDVTKDMDVKDDLNASLWMLE